MTFELLTGYLTDQNLDNLETGDLLKAEYDLFGVTQVKYGIFHKNKTATSRLSVIFAYWGTSIEAANDKYQEV